MLLTPRAGGGSAARVTSVTVYTVPVAVNVGNVVYLTGANAVDDGDNTSTSTVPVMGLVISKPTTTTAILLYFGETPSGVLSGLTPAAIYFLGTAGLITATPPTAVGSVIQKIGEAIDADTLLFAPSVIIVL